MDTANLKQQIKQLGGWYQKIDLDGIVTTSSTQSTIDVWKKIRLLTGDIKGKKILDLGCNAGLYSINSIIEGAREVIGVELNSTFFNQALFIKDYYENKYKKLFPLTYLKMNISDIDFSTIGKFDIVYAIAVLYHVGKHRFGKNTIESLNEQKNIIKKLCEISNCIIVRGRRGTTKDSVFYNQEFSKYNFKNVKEIPEGKRMLIKYERI